MATDKDANLPAIPAEIVNVAVNLDKDDVAAILMSRAEEHLKGGIKTCQKRDKELKKTSETLSDQLQKQLEEAAAAHFEATIETLTDAAQGLKVKTIESKTSATGYSERGGRGSSGTVHCELQVTGNKPRINWHVSQDARMPAAVKKTVADHKANDKKQTDNHREWMDFRRKLADLPSMERRAKAAVAEQRLKATAEGIELIEMLDRQLDSGIKLLGVS